MKDVILASTCLHGDNGHHHPFTDFFRPIKTLDFATK